MAFREISLEKFEEYNFTRQPNLIGLVREEYWYSEDEAGVIGTVLLDNIDKDWSFVIMAKEDDGEYRAIDMGVSHASETEAIDTISQKILKIAADHKAESSLYESTLFNPQSTVIISNIDDEVKRFFNKYPHKLYEMNPRKFEELIASIMKDFGFSVELTKATRDGGRDIIASLKNSVSNYLTYVECKRYAPDNKVDVGIIRAVSGVHYTRKPSKSIIVTTSFFTKAALEEAKMIENQLELKDFNHIKAWLNTYR